MDSNQQQFEATIREVSGVISLQKKTLGQLDKTQTQLSEELAKAPLSQMSSTQLAALAHQVAAQMREYARLYSHQDSTIDNAYWSRLTSSTAPTASDRQRLLAEERRKREELRTEYDKATAKLVANANAIRAVMLDRVFPADQKRVSEANPESRGGLYQLADDADHLEHVAAEMLAALGN